MKRLLLLFAALLACGLIAAGCGDDDDDNGDDSPATTETAPADSTETTPSDDTSEDLDDLDSVDEAVEACKDSVEATSGQLSEDLQNDLKDICEQAADGDEEEIRDATLEICRRIVEETVPDEATREQALAACESAVQE